MNNDAVIFLGPTILPCDAQSFLQARFLPPVSQGDVHEAFKRFNPKVIGIIDGYFENIPSVWHKEILYVMSQGVHVIGSSSMGALRAAELSAFGMEGVGRIFAAYDSGLIEDDDEVAVLHAPAELGYAPLSEALVNIRESCARALSENVVSGDFVERLIHVAKSTFYKDRTYNNVFRKTEIFSPHETKAFKLWLVNNAQNVKRDDAILLLNRIKCLLIQDLPPKKVNYNFEKTAVWLESVSIDGGAAFNHDQQIRF